MLGKRAARDDDNVTIQLPVSTTQNGPLSAHYEDFGPYHVMCPAAGSGLPSEHGTLAGYGARPARSTCCQTVSATLEITDAAVQLVNNTLIVTDF